MAITDRLLPAAYFTFKPANRAIDFAATPGFDPKRVLAVVNDRGGETIYFKGEPDLAYTLSGSSMLFPYDTTAMAADDPVSVFYEPDTARPASSSVATSDASGAIATGAVLSAAGVNLGRQILILSNTGGSPLAYRFDADPSATVGHPLAPGETVRFDAKCPTGELRLFSSGGTSYCLTTG